MTTMTLARDAEPDFERIREVLLRCVRRASPRSMQANAEDIVQTALTRIVAQMEAESMPMSFNSSYLWKVANHAVIDEIRRRQRRPEELTDRADASSSEGGDPLAAEHSRRIRHGVRECLERANPERRAALGLYLQGLTLAEVGTSLQWEQKRTQNLIYRGLSALRACLAGKGLQP